MKEALEIYEELRESAETSSAEVNKVGADIHKSEKKQRDSGSVRSGLDSNVAEHSFTISNMEFQMNKHQASEIRTEAELPK